VEAGHWIAPYTGIEVTEARLLDIDHVVPLANAHRSGGWAWSAEDRRVYANELTNPQHRVAATASANHSKGARGPEEWGPPDEGYWRTYATDWVGVKAALGTYGDAGGVGRGSGDAGAVLGRNETIHWHWS
jgi:hypothetical protein